MLVALLTWGWQNLAGVLLVSFVVILLIWAAVFYYYGWVKLNRLRQYRWTVVSVAAYVVFAVAFWWITKPDYTFPPHIAGILVLQIEGDDESNSLQRKLCSELNTLVSNDSLDAEIHVHRCDRGIQADKGDDENHRRARAFGKEFGAMLVVWGNCTGDRELYPRFTVVDEQAPMRREHTLGVYVITEGALPPILVDQPLYLARFVAGYAAYDRGAYRSALPHFERALAWKDADQSELMAIRFYAATACIGIAQGSLSRQAYAQRAIEHLAQVIDDAIANFEGRFSAGVLHALAIAHALHGGPGHAAEAIKLLNFLGGGETRLSDSDRSKIMCTQGVVYLALYDGANTALLDSAVTAFGTADSLGRAAHDAGAQQAALTNLGRALLRFPGNRLAGDAIEALKRAEQIREREGIVAGRALIQINLADGYRKMARRQSSPGERDRYRRMSTQNYRQAIGQYQSLDSERKRAIAWRGLGSCYSEFETGDVSEFSALTAAAFDSAAALFGRVGDTAELAKTHTRLGDANVRFGHGVPGSFDRAIDAYTQALKELGPGQTSGLTAEVHNGLGLAYKNRSITLDCDALVTARDHLSVAESLCVQFGLQLLDTVRSNIANVDDMLDECDRALPTPRT